MRDGSRWNRRVTAGFLSSQTMFGSYSLWEKTSCVFFCNDVVSEVRWGLPTFRLRPVVHVSISFAYMLIALTEGKGKFFDSFGLFTHGFSTILAIYIKIGKWTSPATVFRELRVVGTEWIDSIIKVDERLRLPILLINRIPWGKHELLRLQTTITKTVITIS